MNNKKGISNNRQSCVLYDILFVCVRVWHHLFYLCIALAAARIKNFASKGNSNRADSSKFHPFGSASCHNRKLR